MRIHRAALAACAIGCLGVTAAPPDGNLVDNGSLERRGADGRAAGFSTVGGVEYRYLGDPRRDSSSYGFALESARPQGEVSCVVTDLDAAAGRWFRFTFRGLPQGNFAVSGGDLHMRVAFAGQRGRVEYDGKAKPIYDEVEQARRDLTVNGVRHAHGAEVWRTYQLDFMLPFPQVDTVTLAVGFTGGAATAPRDSEFFVDDVSLVRIPDPPGEAGPPARPAVVAPTGPLLPLGGRWYYAARDGEATPPQRFDASNVDRLLYHDAVYSAPFAGQTTAWLKAGDKDLDGSVVTRDRLVVDNVTLTFTGDALVVHSHGIPNHPTGRFPELGFGNPNYITEQDETFYLPVNPRVNPNHRVTDANNPNRALPMGPIGIAVNGVVFFNPFDMGSQDATNMMDRCCGHPNQDGQYHYHKYPICVNSPWSDQGTGHSALIGFAFDGLPVYGPYERAGVMAKDVTGPGALNAFNACYDAQRGWHYHVTPGQFPYLIGGFWAYEDSRDNQRPPRRGGFGQGGSGGPGGRMPGPPPWGP
jgi:hypothetical protein